MTELHTAEELQRALAKPTVEIVNGVPHIITPPGFEIRELESMLEEPRRIRANVTAHDIGGLVSYVNRFKVASTALYSGPRQKPQIQARIDDNRSLGNDGDVHDLHLPSHVTHRCQFDCPYTVEWTNWTQANGRRLNQIEFAEFIENNIKDVIEPNGADLLTATLAFQDTGRVEFRSTVRTNDGRVQFTYAEKEEGGEVKFPERIKVAVPVFEGMKHRYPIEARVRYRIKEGALTIWYELDRPDLVVRAAYSDLIEHVEKETSIHVHRAS